VTFQVSVAQSFKFSGALPEPCWGAYSAASWWGGARCPFPKNPTPFGPRASALASPPPCDSHTPHVNSWIKLCINVFSVIVYLGRKCADRQGGHHGIEPRRSRCPSSTINISGDGSREWTTSNEEWFCAQQSTKTATGKIRTTTTTAARHDQPGVGHCPADVLWLWRCYACVTTSNEYVTVNLTCTSGVD